MSSRTSLGPRLTITFTDPQLAWLREEAKRLGISVGDLVRRLIDQIRRWEGEDTRYWLDRLKP